ncbi:MAG: molybdopterin-guanine dinucleotide biosynthesis protein B [Clostridia bacterium]|nr:molybdopterin-guanine dinucleotide biosynthesis protein B [Clostridia bacterium]
MYKGAALCAGACAVSGAGGVQRRGGGPLNAAVFIFAGFANTGKTTYICGLVRALLKRGRRVAVVKDAREHALLSSGKDSDRFLEAGAACAGLAGSDAAMLLMPGAPSLDTLLGRLPADTEIVLAEGFKREPFPQIGLYRAASGQPLPAPPERYIALVTDTPLDAPTPQFPLSDPEPLADFLLSRLEQRPFETAAT